MTKTHAEGVSNLYENTGSLVSGNKQRVTFSAGGPQFLVSALIMNLEESCLFRHKPKLTTGFHGNMVAADLGRRLDGLYVDAFNGASGTVSAKKRRRVRFQVLGWTHLLDALDQKPNR